MTDASRRSLTWAIAGFVVLTAPVFGQESRAAPGSGEADAAIATARSLLAKEPPDFLALRKALNQAEVLARPFPEKKAEVKALWGRHFEREWSDGGAGLLEQLKKAAQDPARREDARELMKEARAAAVSLNKDYRDAILAIERGFALSPFDDRLDSARARESAGDLPGALSEYDALIDDLGKAFDKKEGKPQTKEMLELYKTTIAASDRLAAKVETPEFEKAIPVRDLLDPKERDVWASSQATSMTFDSNSLVLEGVDTGRKITGVISAASWDPAWRDIVLDLELTIVTGKTELYLRYAPGNPNFLISLSPQAGYELNKPYRLTLRVTGSKVELQQPGQNRQTDTLKGTVSRTGGFGFGVTHGSKVVISSCKLKVLR